MKNLLTAILLLFAFSASAQLLPEQNMYTRNLFLINPASAGTNGKLSALVGYKSKWQGFEDAPRNAYFAIDGMASEHMGLGMMLNNQQMGLLNLLNVSLNYSYRVDFADAHYLSLGASFTFIQNQIRTKGLSNQELSFLAESNKFDKTFFSGGAGVSYHIKGLDLELAMPLIYSSQEEIFAQGVMAFLGYDIFMANKSVRVQPSVFSNYSFSSPVIADVNLMIEWNKMIWAQVGYRTSSELLIGAGLAIKHIGIGYTYGYNMGSLSYFGNSSHEIQISFRSLFAKKE